MIDYFLTLTKSVIYKKYMSVIHQKDKEKNYMAELRRQMEKKARSEFYRCETNEITKEEFNDQWTPFSIIDDANQLQVLV